MAETMRMVALGASNLTRGISMLANLARGAWGPGVQLFAALGYGRSYGSTSRVGFRTLPSILKSGLWKTLDSMPPTSTKALVMDVGNDILYGFPLETILAWVGEVMERLARITPDITLVSLPLENIRQLSRIKYFIARSVLFPGCRISLECLLASAEELNAGLAELAAKRNARFFRPNPSWYGVDPIHVRRRFWPSAWSKILETDAPGAHSTTAFAFDRLKLRIMAPEQRWLFGVERFTRQSGHLLSSEVRIWLF
jgi:hypothetical protein